jgi:hypothetical protein
MSWPLDAGVIEGSSAKAGVSATWIAFPRSHPRLHSKVVFDLESLVHLSFQPGPTISWLAGVGVRARG